MTASCGIASPAGALALNSRSTNISGRRTKPGFSASSRSFKVRDAGSKSGGVSLTVAKTVFPRSRIVAFTQCTRSEKLRVSCKETGSDPDLAQIGDAVKLSALFKPLAGRDIARKNDSINGGKSKLYPSDLPRFSQLFYLRFTHPQGTQLFLIDTQTRIA